VNDGHASTEERQAEDLDLLIETWKDKAERAFQRRDAVEGRAAAVTTAAIGLGTILVTQADKLSEGETAAQWALFFLMATILVSLLARAAPRIGVAKSFRTWLSERLVGLRTDSQESVDKAEAELIRAATAVRSAAEIAPGGSIDVRLAVLDYWTMQAESTKRSYNAKARWIAAAVVLFAAALLCLALLGVALVGSPAK
jgi:hypothetical protein